MIRGGYLCLDLKGKAITVGGSAVTVPGAYDTLEGNYGKAVLLCGLNVGGTAQKEEWINTSLSGTSYVATLASGKLLTITSADAVTITTPV